MVSEIHSAFVNYYDYLNVPQNAPTTEIEDALQKLTASAEIQANNSLTMKSARRVLNEVIPSILQHLLSDAQARAAYDRELLEALSKQAQRGELADDEGLDDALRQPFFFDPYEGYDTETPALSLRQIALKLDEEWPRACNWITDTSNDSHVFVGFLIHVAGRVSLAKRIEQIIMQATHQYEKSISVNEAIERCIYILDPQIERPVVDIYNDTFDGKVLLAGEFVSDQPAQSELILGHAGFRGCAFGKIESQTDWLRFAGGQSSIQYTLMPEGTDTKIALSQVKIALFFQVSRLERNAEHCAKLLLRVENYQPAVEVVIEVRIFAKPLPPRVYFEPAATANAPAWAGLTLCGVPGTVVITPHNGGDEKLVHLTARLSTNDAAARADPALFAHEKPIAVTIDTRNRRRGEKYHVVFQVNYGPTPGAIGPGELHIEGELLPTPWQSMLRQRSMEQRLGWGCGGSIAGLFLIGLIGMGLAAHAGIAWLLVFILPAIFVLVVRPSVATIVKHIQRSGNTTITFKKVPPWILWWIPLGAGLVLALLSLFLPDAGTAFLIAGILGGIIGAVAGFIVDLEIGTKVSSSSTAV